MSFTSHDLKVWRMSSEGKENTPKAAGGAVMVFSPPAKGGARKGLAVRTGQQPVLQELPVLTLVRPMRVLSLDVHQF